MAVEHARKRRRKDSVSGAQQSPGDSPLKRNKCLTNDNGDIVGCIGVPVPRKMREDGLATHTSTWPAATQDSDGHQQPFVGGYQPNSVASWRPTYDSGDPLKSFTTSSGANYGSGWTSRESLHSIADQNPAQNFEPQAFLDLALRTYVTCDGSSRTLSVMLNLAGVGVSDHDGTLPQQRPNASATALNFAAYSSLPVWRPTPSLYDHPGVNNDLGSAGTNDPREGHARPMYIAPGPDYTDLSHTIANETRYGQPQITFAGAFWQTSPGEATREPGQAREESASPALSRHVNTSRAGPVTVVENPRSPQIGLPPEPQPTQRRKYKGFLWPCNPGIDFPGIDSNAYSRRSSASQSSSKSR